MEGWLDEARWAAKVMGWRVSSVARGMARTGWPWTLRLPGALVLLRDLPRGKANPSLAFRFLAANDPHRVAIVDPRSLTHAGEEDRVMSFFELDRALDRVAASLASRGVRKGASVILALKNRPEFLIAQAALGRLGASAVSVSWRSTVPEIEYIARHSEAKAVLFDADIASTIEGATKALEDKLSRDRFFAVPRAEGFASWDDLVAPRPHAALDEDDSEEGAVVMYTSGTTGKPKGAVRKFQKNALAFAMAFLAETPMKVGEKHLVVCPLYHATAFAFVGFNTALQGSVVVLPEFKPELVLQAIDKYKITTTALVPTMIHRIVALGEDVIRRYDLSSLKCIFSGGAPLSGQLALDAMNALGDKLWNFYGATETGIVTLASPADLRASPGTIGHLMPGNDVRLLDDEGRDVKECEVGELYVRSPALIDGYHADREATNQAMRDGYFSVGDLARRDARGCYFLEGRKRDMIITGGVNVYPAEVEETLHAHPAVADAAVVGVEDPDLGERVRAFVVKRPGADIDGEQLKAFMKTRLAGFKVPREFVFLDALPRNPTGKVLKRELRTLAI